MKQPLMPLHIPPAQAEALYDAALKSERLGRAAPSKEAYWPGEDWDDDVPADAKANAAQEKRQASALPSQAA